ncbi:MAG: hypothetical protein KIT17_23525 [Rubrivivax sp.]|nr:hypothetical protein [Rubrivivax sp.]
MPPDDALRPVRLPAALAIVLLFTMLVAAPARAAPSKELAALIGKPFSAIRGKLIEQGWTPVETNLRAIGGVPERARGEAAKFLEAGFTEIERCTGGAKNYCFLNYSRRGKCLRIRTLGVLALPDTDPKVHGAGDACPARQAAPR